MGASTLTLAALAVREAQTSASLGTSLCRFFRGLAELLPPTLDGLAVRIQYLERENRVLTNISIQLSRAACRCRRRSKEDGTRRKARVVLEISFDCPIHKPGGLRDLLAEADQVHYSAHA